MLSGLNLLFGDNKRKPLMLPPSKYAGNLGAAKKRQEVSHVEYLQYQRESIKRRGLEPRKDKTWGDHRFHEINAHHRKVDSKYGFLYGSPPIGIGPKMSPFSKKNRETVHRMNLGHERFAKEMNKEMRKHGLPKMF